MFQGALLHLSPADTRLLVYLRDLPTKIDDDVISTSFSEYGEVLSVSHCYYNDFPDVRNGNRLVKMLLSEPIPCFVRVDQFDCQVWYAGQPPKFSICRASGHRAPACPLSALCRQPGHMARECVQAWGPSVSAPVADVPPGSSASSEHDMHTAPVCSVPSSDSVVPDTVAVPVPASLSTAPAPVVNTAPVANASALHCSECFRMTKTSAIMVIKKLFS